MHALLAEGMRTGEVMPLPWTVYARNNMQDAFRYMASGAVLADTLTMGFIGYGPGRLPPTGSGAPAEFTKV